MRGPAAPALAGSRRSSSRSRAGRWFLSTMTSTDYEINPSTNPFVDISTHEVEPAREVIGRCWHARRMTRWAAAQWRQDLVSAVDHGRRHRPEPEVSMRPLASAGRVGPPAASMMPACTTAHRPSSHISTTRVSVGRTTPAKRA